MVALVSPEVPGGEVVVQLIFTPNIWITIVTVTGNFTVTGKVTTINISNLNAQCSMFLCMSECWHILEGFSRTCSSHHTPTIIIPDPLAGDSSRQQHQYQITLVVMFGTHHLKYSCFIWNNACCYYCLFVQYRVYRTSVDLDAATISFWNTNYCQKWIFWCGSWQRMLEYFIKDTLTSIWSDLDCCQTS